mgnify:CR=1 FL=1
MTNDKESQLIWEAHYDERSRRGPRRPDTSDPSFFGSVGEDAFVVLKKELLTNFSSPDSEYEKVDNFFDLFDAFAVEIGNPQSALMEIADILDER